ncbi:hypothetical protein [Streptomyces sp. JJ36]|uniref:hypothetical protein n=1 Tax=Streptomyces sp. JJ36 TaxID=2736645 RepID=UPI001F44F244|nr:hypothetical protein [Streptomyces sp. JJ36]MCF6522904.1 hypothetical protein [Streptomyces sp. JJ36]
MASEKKEAAARQAGRGQQPEEHTGGRTLTVTLPRADRLASGAVHAALLPVAVAREVLPAKGGLPLYLGLGALGAADVLDWPVAVGIGLGYALLRRPAPRTAAAPA